MVDIPSTLVGVAATCLIGTAAYFGKRWIEGKRASDAIDRHSKALALRKALKEERVTVEDLNSFALGLTKRSQRARQIEDKVAKEVGAQRISGPQPGESQTEMNRLAGADLRIADAMLERTLTEAEMHCEGAALEHLNKSQETWKAYAEAEARYRASQFEGEVPPVSWTPGHLCSRSPQWQESTHLTRRSSGGR